MLKNYFYLLRAVKDLSPVILGSRVLEIYTQERDKLFINVPNDSGGSFHVIISTNPQLSFITTKNEHHKARKNVKMFFEHFLPDTIENVQIAVGDRIIKISLSLSEIYFVIRGAGTNVFLIDKNSDLHCFKKIDDVKSEPIKKELLGLEFTNDPTVIKNLFMDKSKEEIIKKYKFVDKDILREIEKRSGEWNENLQKIIDEICFSDIAIEMNENLPKPVFVPSTFSYSEDAFIFHDYFSAINKYFSLFYSIGKDKQIKAELERFLEKELERTSNKLNDIKTRIENGSKDEKYFTEANLLLSNIYLIKKGMKEIEINDDLKNQAVRIKLDEKLSPQQNIDNLFEKARSEKINFQKSKELFEKLEKDYLKLIGLQKRISETESLEDLLNIKKELKLKMETHKYEGNKDSLFNFRHFIIEGKYHLFVGKDSKNNDLLTTKFAKQNDFWFHARAASGSHAVLRVENTKEAIPKNILKKAASVAAFYSKSKTSKLAPVSYTFKKYVVKKKDLNPGQVILLKEDVLLVTPEIPAGCEMIENE
jgi:predicted ribosome quality control (RQC) complex YloA/Tae2 family protein